MAQALATASEEMLQQRDPSLLILPDETELYLVDRRFSTTSYGDTSGNIICKLVYPDSTIPKFLESVKKEVEFQNKAAKHNLGPKIYEHGFSQESIPFTGFYEYEDDNDGETKRIQFNFPNPFYYIIMEYYSKKNGWKGPVYVLGNQIDSKLSNNDLFYKFIHKLIFDAKIANIYDPIMHFYYHPVHGLRMIDYGRCIDCTTTDQQEAALNAMMKALEITKKPNSASKIPRRRSISRSPNKSPKTSSMTRKSRSRSPKTSHMTRKSRSRSPKTSPMTRRSHHRSSNKSSKSPRRRIPGNRL